MRLGKSLIVAALAASAATVLGGSVEDIGKAPEPSAAIQAYVGAPDRTSPEVERAYVRRMEELGSPELADAQAKDVVAHDPHDATGWAALAESNAKRGKMPEALAAISNIAGQPVDDPIVHAAAGRLVAWYQNFGSSVQIDPAIKQRIDELNQQLANKPAYADAMNKAKAAYSSQNSQPPAAAQNAPVQAAPAQSAPVATQQPAAPQQQPVYPQNNNSPLQNNPGPYGGTPIQAPPQQQPVQSADVNVQQQREYVSGDTVYQSPAYSSGGNATYGSPAYVQQPVYAPAPTYYYDSYPYYYPSYYYGPSIAFGFGYYGGYHDYYHNHYYYHDDHHNDHFDHHDDHSFHGDSGPHGSSAGGHAGGGGGGGGMSHGGGGGGGGHH